VETVIAVRTAASLQEVITAQELLAQTFPDHTGATVDSAIAYRALYPEQADLMAITVDEASAMV